MVDDNFWNYVKDIRILEQKGVFENKKVAIQKIKGNIYFNIIFEKNNEGKFDVKIIELGDEEKNEVFSSDNVKKQFKKIREYANSLSDESPKINYTYLLGFYDNQLNILSCYMGNRVISYSHTKEIAEEIGINVEKPIWVGTYFKEVSFATCDDVQVILY